MKLQEQCCWCRRFRTIQDAGLCRKCLSDKDVRRKLGLKVRNPEEDPTGNMSEAELDALIAEQYACLPAWWYEEPIPFSAEDEDAFDYR